MPPLLRRNIFIFKAKLTVIKPQQLLLRRSG